ncbi:aflatoxin B1 aldehyde reductase-like protein member 2 [Karstenula rhodostoma CBS 690.94]|uniref:Aflatoxin B1 aldehyde reductase-like protein member 2 n=1 Tax=Karstenula rhodostoma CBS 690.94 TaxID=1392251 RepID=A0A9P4PRA6_9PLEO|nr:aflatoxin B1 aldehyde reductase-like protein member 2 [Karstenula rhodostoma CBS 690.94]
MAEIKAVFGGGAFPQGVYADARVQAEALDVLQKAGVKVIDSARLYLGSEEAIGKLEGRTNFTIDTKLPGGFNKGNLSKDQVTKDISDSVQKLGVPQVDILYIHAPDDTADIHDTLAGINEAYKKGQFRRFGLSNFSAQQVQEVYDVATEKGYVKPTVYQGNYSPVARHLETLLFPTLRKLGIAFYAYSPLAGGFLTKTPADLDAGAGRFNAQATNGMYSRLYDKPSLRAALGEWNAAAEAEGVSKAELAYRWVGYNSALKAELGDAVIFGASKISQIEQTAGGLKKGGLSKSAVERIDKIWESVKKEAPVNNLEGL